ncbi:hypothetical protein [Notoacmeibacter sp. MSK16QG-6]|uniref:hypothetical protein n=1 Tax=Notoacmeibacter sp. MSK16QG-6 TaxID=2957982 RepID=UPI00209FE924|nr:hypothetical protein [Notoacmeibacter sp. MSK16QG-6]MCP1199166.1 hypothetical protein [Notoacmeibacter sp. MSK16QG-6]
MSGISRWFLSLAAIFALIGMAWGIQMSATHDHTLSPAHGHLNLIGFVAMSVFGLYYALTPHAAGRLAMAHLALTVLAIVVLTPGIAMAISGTGETLAKIGSVFAILSMAVFAYTVIRHGVGKNLA